MSLLSELTRPYWLPGLHSVSDFRSASIRSWINNGEYQVYSTLQQDQALLNFQTIDPVARAFAGDISRMSVAAFESIEGIAPSARLPKSSAWMLVRSYYAAFFAAHCLLRIFGRSCTQLDNSSVNAIHEIADLFGERGDANLHKGLYRVLVDSVASTVQLERISSAEGGSHIVLWAEFSSLLSTLSETVLVSTPTRAGQLVSAKLIELRTAMLGFSAASNSWLSFVRNRINYQLEFGAWFPYRERQPYYDTLFEKAATWEVDPMDLTVWSEKGRELQRFIETIVMIVSMCRVVIEDMTVRAPTGKSFHRYGYQALLGILRQSRPAKAQRP